MAIDHLPTDHALSRRALLGLGAGAAGAAVAGVSTPAFAGGGSAWPSGALPLSAATRIDTSQFFSAQQLATWGAEADALGLRATGAPNHEAYLRKLKRRFERAGLHDVRLEPVPMMRWLADSWSVEVDGRVLPDTYYVPYSRATEATGLTAEMVYVPLREALLGSTSDIAEKIATVLAGVDVSGKIAVFEVPYTSFPVAAFQLLSYPGAFDADGRDTSGTYNRPWFNFVVQCLDALAEAGAAGTVGIWHDLPGSWARQYSPYDGVFRPIPGLWVDSVEGATLKEKAASGGVATITLRATTQDVVTHNLIGFIPGESKQLTVLHTHTDGTNGMEENGQIGILATAQYLARLPRRALGRTVMVMLSTGHFAGGVGIRHFLAQHAATLVPRITSIVTLEHLGCREFLPDEQGVPVSTGQSELGAYFTPNAPGLVDASVNAHHRVGNAGTVCRPFVPSPADAEQPVGWPGEGVYFWWYGSIPTSNYITGPYGLITADLDTTGMVDYRLMRKIAISTVRTVIQLGRTPRQDLHVIA